jgi:hypothetical protein
MPPRKTTTLNLRVDPAIKKARRENPNMIEVLIRRHCESVGIIISGE